MCYPQHVGTELGFTGLPLLLFSTMYLYNYIVYVPLYIHIVIVAFLNLPFTKYLPIPTSTPHFLQTSLKLTHQL